MQQDILQHKTQKKIRKLHSLGKKVQTIARLVKVDKNTVSIYIAKKKKIKIVRKISKRLGRHTVITSKVREKVKNSLAQKSASSVKVLRRRIRSKLCLPTLRKAVRHLGGTFSAQKRPIFLSPYHKEMRVKFATEKLSNIENWKKYVYVDEKKFKMDGPEGHQRKWSIPNLSPKESQRSRNYRETVMIFAGINFERKTSIQFAEHTWNARDYVKALKLMFDEMRNDDEEDEYVLYQDNASIHIAKLTKELLEAEDIQSVQAPARSPDLNPIENAWTQLS
ncbi:MAG: putative Transposable element Tc3 transposase, partial [Streblomastix strix]